ncbi:MAG: hypothetical protein HYT16_01575 [DPANN group archaeon]|nr:hypothetical protein [DPANN group archaeon]
MATHIIYGKTCKVKVNIPKSLDENTRRVLAEIAKNCLEPKNQKIANTIIKDVTARINVLINSLKKSKLHSPALETAIREFLGFYLNHGFQFGKDMVPPEATEEPDSGEFTGVKQEVTNVYELLKQQYNYKKSMAKVKGRPREMGAILFYCMDMTRLAFEAGLTLGLYLSEEKIEEYYNEFGGKEVAYIG